MQHSEAHDRRVALSVTTVGILAATLNSSILLISLPAIFAGLGLDPLAPENISYLLWMLMGFLLVTAVLVVTFGRLGDQYGRAQAVQPRLPDLHRSARSAARSSRTAARPARWRSSCCASSRASAARWSWPTRRRSSPTPSRPTGAASRSASTRSSALAGSFLGLVIGGVLSEWNWRAVFWVSVPVGVWGTWMGYRTLHDKPRDRTHAGRRSTGGAT